MTSFRWIPILTKLINELVCFAFQIIAQLSGLLRHEIMDFMFSNPTMLDDLDFLYKSDSARKLMFYYQVNKGSSIANKFFYH